MEASLASQSDHLLPSLPIELKREILRFCDPSTLASTSRSSLAFLELSSPLLYQHITINGTRGLERLFCVSDPSSRQISLEPYLDLRQVKSFILVIRPNGGAHSFDGLQLHDDRLSSSEEPLPVKKLTLRVLRQADGVGERYGFSQLLSYFDPSQFVVSASQSSTKPEDSFIYLDLPLLALPWTRLETITFVNSGPSRHLATYLAETSTRPLVVIYDLARQWPFEELEYAVDAMANTLDDVLGRYPEEEWMDDELALLNSPFLRTVVFRVECSDQSKHLEEHILMAWAANEVEAGKRARWAGLIEFDEVDSGARRVLTLRN